MATGLNDEGGSADDRSATARMEEEEEESRRGEDEEQEVEEEEGAEPMSLSSPQCDNKAIAFIMGCPCSDDDSQSESSDEDEDDDGFDSEGSSDLSDSSDDEDDDDDDDDDDEEASDSEEADSEAERLWSSLCRSRDPYDPRNFTARLHTGRTSPRSIPVATATPTPPPSSSSTQSSPASSLSLSPPRAPPSPPSGSDWDDASEPDEAEAESTISLESAQLWNSFSANDPYSLFNFQAPLRTHGPAAEPEPGPPQARTRSKKAPQTPPGSPPHHDPAAPPQYRKEEAEERLDSGFSEPSTGSSGSSQTCSAKKVRFRDDVEEFFASSGEEDEDRRGPWEELARDRCRFLRRCQEVELSIAYVLTPQHRTRVSRRLAVLYVQDA